MDKIARRRRGAGQLRTEIGHMRIFLTMVFGWLTTVSVWSQGPFLTVQGLEPNGSVVALPGVTVQFSCEGQVLRVAGTDMDGRLDASTFSGLCRNGCEIKASFVGYQAKSVDCQSLQSEGLTLVLGAATESLGEVVVTASIAGATVQEETVPVTVLKPYLNESANSVDLKGLVSKTPGVSIMDGQVSIRGGSGYSYGVGSRVQMLLDDMPLLSGDLGEIWWSYLPMEHVAQVEVVKATASSMYGSGASNGVIHMRTAWPGDEPETFVSAFNGVYSDPDYSSWRWWNHSYSPVSNGMSLSHRQKFGKVDLVAGGNMLSDKTYLSVGHEQRMRANVKLRYRHSPLWQFGGGFQGQYQQMGRFILWDDFVTNAYLPMEGTSSEDRWFNWHVDAWAKRTPMSGGSHHFNLRAYETARYGEDTIPTMVSRLTMFQNRYVRHLGDHWTTQVGQMTSVQRSFSSLYPDIQLLTFNPALFAQLEWAQNGWRASGGIRWEWNLNPGQASLREVSKYPVGKRFNSDPWFSWIYNEASGPIARIGLNRSLGEGLNLRMSYGESLRFASIAEKYVEGTLTDGISIQGNIDLVSESGNNWELGLVQELKSDRGSMLLEASAFLLNYDEMIEYTLRPQTNDDGNIIIIDGEPQFFFQPLNLGRTRIGGYELSLTGEGKVGPIPVRTVVGYTFNYAGDLTNDPAQENMRVYLDNFFQAADSASRDSLILAGSLLKYRNRGAFKADVEWDMGPFTAGFAVNHQTFIDTLDWYFLELIDGLANYREQFTNGAKRVDARLSYNSPQGHRFSFIVNNLSNGIVSTRPGILGAPRHFMVRMDFAIGQGAARRPRPPHATPFPQ